MESLPLNKQKRIYATIFVFNGKYDPKLFSYDLITFAALMGYLVDMNNVFEFVESSVWKKNPEYRYVIKDTSKEETEAKLNEIREKLKELSKANDC